MADTAERASLAFDGVRWTRRPGGNPTNVFGEPHSEQPVDAGWLAVTHDGAVWIVVEVLAAHPSTGETGRALACARCASKDLQPYVDHAYLIDDDVDHISPPNQRAVAEVVSMAATLIGRRTRGRNVRVDGQTRWLLAVVERLTSVMTEKGWAR